MILETNHPNSTFSQTPPRTPFIMPEMFLNKPQLGLGLGIHSRIWNLHPLPKQKVLEITLEVGVKLEESKNSSPTSMRHKF